MLFKKEDGKKYDPVTATVPGVDQRYRQEILDEISLAGDPHGPKAVSETPVVETPTIIQRIKKKINLV